MEESTFKIYDIRLIFGSSMTVAGPSGSGKTSFVKQLIENIDIFNEKPERIIWCYGATPPPPRIGNFSFLSNSIKSTLNVKT